MECDTVDFSSEIRSMDTEAARLRGRALLALNELVTKIPTSPLSKLSYAYTARAKTEYGLLEKIHRKRGDEKIPKPKYSIPDITDVVGIRFVTLYRSQITSILEIILAELTGKLGNNGLKTEDLKQLFIKNSNMEAIIYHNHPHDQFSLKCSNIIAEAFSQEPKIELKTDYSSIHLVAQLSDGNDGVVPVEIQIRTVFEDAWGQLNHKFKYSEESGKKSTSTANNPSLVNSLLSNLKRFTDACSEYADLISNEASGVSEETIEPIVIDVKDHKDVLKRMKEAGVPKAITPKYIEAVRLRVTAEGLAEKHDEDSDSAFYQAAEHYQQVLELYESHEEDKNERSSSLLTYYCMMNKAFCYLSSSKFIGNALPIYEELMGEYSGYPMVLYRYGQAREKLGDSEGVMFIREAYDLAAQIYLDDKQQDSDTLPIKDYLHIISRAPIKLGYVIWSSADKAFTSGTIDKDEFIKKLEHAYQVTHATMTAEYKNIKVTNYLEGDDILVSLNNNLLYYSSEIVDLLQQSARKIDHWSKALGAHLDFLITSANIKDDDIRRMETLSRAFFLVNDFTQAMEYSNKVLELALSGKLTDITTTELHELAKKAHLLQKRMQKK